MIKLQYIEKNTKHVLSTEEAEEVCRLFEAKFKPFLRNEVFLLETGSTAHQTQLKCTLAKNDGSIAFPIEAVCVLREADVFEGLLETKEQIYAMLDLLNSYFTEYLQEGRNTFLGLDWEPYEHGKYTICLRGFERNLEVERLTEEWFEKMGTGNYSIEPISSTT